MNKNQEVDKGKKHYRKPRLRTIELFAKEVLAEGCKTWGSTTFVAGVDENCGILQSCVVNGS